MTDSFSTPTKEVPRDTYGRYRLYVPGDETRTPKSFQRATTFAKACDETSNLMKWMNRMVAKGIATNDDLLIAAADTDLEDKRSFDRICEAAKKAAGANDAADNGTAIHTLTERYDRGEKIPRTRFSEHLEGYKRIVDNLPIEIPSNMIERVVVLPDLMVAGTFDRLVRFTEDYTITLKEGRKKRTYTIKAGTWVICDVKSNKSMYYSQGSIAIQLALYSRARHTYNIMTEEFEELPEIDQNVALVFHIPSDTAEPALHAFDIQRGWDAVHLAQRVHAFRKDKTLAVEQPLPETGNPFGEAEKVDWFEKFSSANSRSELARFWDEAKLAGATTEELKAHGMRILNNYE